MTTESTPRTDALAGLTIEMRELARTLERELADQLQLYDLCGKKRQALQQELDGHGATIIQLSDELAGCHESRNIQADTIVRLRSALEAIADHVKGPMNNVAHLQAVARAALVQS